METKFTKGEWRQSHRKKPNGMYSTEVYDEQGETICTLAWHKVPIIGGFETDREANAKLIAAAPKMYDALKKCYVLLRELGYGNGSVAENAIRTLKKATE